MEAKRIVVSGVVQGVGYRSFVLSVARKLNMGGYVRNLPDGTVEVVVQPEDESQLGSLLAELKKGPIASRVTGVRVNALSGFDEQLNGFTVRY
jgi:acylphosphatase